jgi:hypothetical protein
MPLPKFTHRQKKSSYSFLLSALVVAALGAGLMGCGGGGGSDTSSTSGSQTGDTLNPGLVGKFWPESIGEVNFIYPIDANTGIQNLGFNPPVGYNVADIARDGRLVVITETRAISGSTRLEIHDATKPVAKESKNHSIALFKQRFDNYIGTVRLSPDSRYLAFTYANENPRATNSGGLVIYDLQNQTDVNQVSLNDPPVLDTTILTPRVSAIGWLPGGEYRYARADGSVYAGSVNKPGQPGRLVGKITPPAGYIRQSGLAISPDGQKIAVVFVGDPLRDDPVFGARTDVWLTDINGGNLERLTNDNKSGQPLWSPDGKFIALTYRFISGTGEDYCQRWYVPSTARNATFAGGAGLPLQFLYGRAGLKSNIGCPPLTMQWVQ